MTQEKHMASADWSAPPQERPSPPRRMPPKTQVGPQRVKELLLDLSTATLAEFVGKCDNNEDAASETWFSFLAVQASQQNQAYWTGAAHALTVAKSLLMEVGRECNRIVDAANPEEARQQRQVTCDYCGAKHISPWN